MLANVGDFCETTLKNMNTHNDMNIWIESPKYCKGYAKLNIDRWVLIR